MDGRFVHRHGPAVPNRSLRLDRALQEDSRPRGLGSDALSRGPSSLRLVRIVDSGAYLQSQAGGETYAQIRVWGGACCGDIGDDAFVRAFPGLRTRGQTSRGHFRNMGNGYEQVVQQAPRRTTN